MKGTKELAKVEPSRMLSPFEELERMERWFEDMWRRPFSLFRSPVWTGGKVSEYEQLSPSVDICDVGNEFHFTADMPGVHKDNLSINVEGNFLTISGEKKHEENFTRENCYRYERSYGTFSRSFELPEGLDTNKAKAHYENGVLQIRIPKTEEAVRKTRKISID